MSVKEKLKELAARRLAQKNKPLDIREAAKELLLQSKGRGVTAPSPKVSPRSPKQTQSAVSDATESFLKRMGVSR